MGQFYAQTKQVCILRIRPKITYTVVGRIMIRDGSRLFEKPQAYWGCGEDVSRVMLPSGLRRLLNRCIGYFWTNPKRREHGEETVYVKSDKRSRLTTTYANLICLGI